MLGARRLRRIIRYPFLPASDMLEKLNIQVEAGGQCEPWNAADQTLVSRQAGLGAPGILGLNPKMLLSTREAQGGTQGPGADTWTSCAQTRPGALLLPLRIREEEREEEGLWLSAQCASLVQQAALKSLRASSRDGAGSSHSTRPPRLHPEL